ncbi:hypothetical protein J6590_017674 [Homalodisca vitripennis]|nr:hypothetical protein J6590_017674 [Homalodisca vitripennis]
MSSVHPSLSPLGGERGLSSVYPSLAPPGGEPGSVLCSRLSRTSRRRARLCPLFTPLSHLQAASQALSSVYPSLAPPGGELAMSSVHPSLSPLGGEQGLSSVYPSLAPPGGEPGSVLCSHLSCTSRRRAGFVLCLPLSGTSRRRSRLCPLFTPLSHLQAASQAMSSVHASLAPPGGEPGSVLCSHLSRTSRRQTTICQKLQGVCWRAASSLEAWSTSTAGTKKPFEKKKLEHLGQPPPSYTSINQSETSSSSDSEIEALPAVEHIGDAVGILEGEDNPEVSMTAMAGSIERLLALSYLLYTNIKLEELFSLQHLHNRRVIFDIIFQSKLINGLVDCPDLLVLIDLGVPKSFQLEIPPYILFIQLWSGKTSEAWWQDIWKY